MTLRQIAELEQLCESWESECGIDNPFEKARRERMIAEHPDLYCNTSIEEFRSVRVDSGDCADELRLWLEGQRSPRARFLNADSKKDWRIHMNGEEYAVLKENLEAAGKWSVDCFTSHGAIVNIKGETLEAPDSGVRFVSPE